MLSEAVLEAAKRYFSPISPNKDNGRVIAETVEIEKLRKFVVARLTTIEKEWEAGWWEDKELMRMFDKLFITGVILLPMDVVERVRWIALVCIAISEHEGFSYGNVLVLEDYFPNEELESLEHLHGERVVEDVQQFRARIAKRGWKSLLK